MLLNITDLSSEPLHRQISDQLAAMILDGELSAGTEFMTVSKLAKEQHVSRSTVKWAYKILRDEGLITEYPGKGFFISPLTPEQRRSLAGRYYLKSFPGLKAIESFSRELVSESDPEKIYKLMADILKDSFNAKSIHIALENEDETGFTLMHSEKYHEKYIINEQDPFLAEIEEASSPVVIAEYAAKIQGSLLLGELHKRKARIVFPLKDSGKLTGFIALGGKITGAKYTGRDLNLLMILANQFLTALCTSRYYVEALEKRRIEEELKMAQRIQEDLLPEKILNSEDFSLAAYTSPSRTVGGDFYDYFPVDDFRIGLVIADAAGNGLPAAMLISQIQGILKSDAGNGSSIRKTLANLNKHLKDNTSPRHFATLFYGEYDLKTGRLEYANAGHDFPILVRGSGRVELLESTGPALGVLPDFQHETGVVRINKGDCLVLYTDGITETMGCDEEEYGAQRLKDLVVGSRLSGPKEIINIILGDLDRFKAPDSDLDDRTLMILKR